MCLRPKGGRVHHGRNCIVGLPKGMMGGFLSTGEVGGVNFFSVDELAEIEVEIGGI